MPEKELKGLCGWGRFPVSDNRAVRPERLRDFHSYGSSSLARGCGRSYGDAALNERGTLILTERLNKLQDFDEATGIVKAEPGVTLQDLLETFVPKGWFLPVTPGTKFCSLGGCVAFDVHGKNHHRDGSFSKFVLSLELILANGEHITCSPNEEAELFWATVGGFGMTGLIASIELQLIPIETSWINVHHLVCKNLDQMVDMLLDSQFESKYSVAWIDCLARGAKLGRGVLMLGEHASKQDLSLRIENPLSVKSKKKKSVPFDFPQFALGPFFVRLFNSFYFAFQSRRGKFLSSYDSYFYPLDGILHWNRMYGKSGFVQYQYVMPLETAKEGTREILEKLSSHGRASFLAVLKKMGNQGPGLMSFPTEGLTLALDIPFRSGLEDFLKELDEIVLRHKGRLYLAKDSVQSPDMVKAGYPRFSDFIEIKNRIDPDHLWNSDMARRIGVIES